MLIDPLLAGIHDQASRLIMDGAKVIDIACGNGTLAFKYAPRASFVTGIDLSSEMINFARKRAEVKKIQNIEFFQLNAEDLRTFAAQEFDIASISMAVHQFSPAVAEKVLQEMKRIARYILIIDYQHPLPGGLSGRLTRIIEWMAGKEHNRNFGLFMNYGGVPGICSRCSLEPHTASITKSVFRIELLKNRSK